MDAWLDAAPIVRASRDTLRHTCEFSVAVRAPARLRAAGPALRE